MNNNMKYLILRDSREKSAHGWHFSEYKNCLGTEVIKLDTGDYTIKGLEDVLCIERKGYVSEFARNIVEKRFYKELDRMTEFRFPFILLEFDMTDVSLYPDNAMPARQAQQCRITGKFIMRKIIEIQVQYGIPIILCGSHGKNIATQIFLRVLDAQKPHTK